MTIASWITVSRLLAVPVLLIALRWQPSTGQLPSTTVLWWCTGIFALAAGTDWLDGYVARRFNQVSDFGKVLDPLVDKLLVLTPLLCLIELREIPAWTVALILCRELAIAGWRVQQPQISGANLWGKAKTVSQILAIACLIAPLTDRWQIAAQGLYGLAIALTLISGVIYLMPAAQPPMNAPQ